MNFRKLSTLTVALMTLVSVNAQNLIPLPKDSAVVYGVLPNGLTYYIRHNEYPEDRACFYIAQKVGATLEEDNQNGLAHFLEHMAFNGTKNFPEKGIIDYMEKQGVGFGTNINAGTSLDYTLYFMTDVPTMREGVVDSALLVLHDWSGFISLEDKEIDKERGVILEEWRQGNRAARRVYYSHIRNTMPGTRYAKRDVIGDTAVINNFKYDELRAYYKKWYRPDLQGIIVVGDVDALEIEKKIKEMWQDVPTPVNPAERVYFTVPNNEKPIVSIVKDEELQNTEMTISFRYDPLPKEVRNSLQGYLQHIMVSIAKCAVNSRGSDICEKADAPILGGSYYFGNEVQTKGVHQFAVVCKNGKMAEAFELMLDEVEKLRRYGITASEFERAMEEVYKYIEDRYKSRAKQMSRSYGSEYSYAFIDDEPFMGIENEYELIKMLKSNLTVDLVNATIMPMYRNNVVIQVSAKADEQLLSEEQILSMLEALPNKELARYEDKRYDEPLIAQKPMAGKIEKESVKEDFYGATEWILSNGIRVLMLPTDYKDNEVRLSAVSKGGYSLVSPEDVLSAAMSSSFVNSFGLGKYSNADLRKMLAGRNAGISSSISVYGEALSGYSSSSEVETLLQLAHLSFGAPREDKEMFDVGMQSIKTSLANSGKEPLAVFNDTISLMLLNDYTYSPHLSLKNVDEINYEKILKIYSERFANPADFTFIIVGDFVIDSIKSHVLTYIGSLETTKEREDKIERDVTYKKGQHKKDLRLEMVTPKLTSFTLYSGNDKYDAKNRFVYSFVGSLLDMRYLESIREDEGGSYGVGVSSRINRLTNQYNLSIQFNTDTAKFEKLYKIVKAEIQNIADNGCKLEDLDKVKKNTIKEYEERLKTNDYWISLIEGKVVYGTDYDKNYAEMVNSVTSEDIQAVVKKILSDNNLIEAVLSPKE